MPGMEQSVRHSVLVVTFNQEAYIEQAIASLFHGAVWPDEVIVADDCSGDGTVDLLMRLREQYPDRIRVMCNRVNLGIYSNLNQLAPLATGDIVHMLAGDDWYEPGMFERMNAEIARRGLNPRGERFMLAPDAYWFKDAHLVRRVNRRPRRS